MKSIRKAVIVALALATGSLVNAQVPSVVSPGFAVDAQESIGAISDVNASPLDGSTALKALTVPANRTFRLTDVSVDPRNAGTAANPCIFEIWRGTDAGPVQLAWSRVRITSDATYDRSWVTGPQFAAGEVLWLVGRFDPFNAGLRLCVRSDPNRPTELRYALRGYLLRSLIAP